MMDKKHTVKKFARPRTTTKATSGVRGQSVQLIRTRTGGVPSKMLSAVKGPDTVWNRGVPNFVPHLVPKRLGMAQKGEGVEPDLFAKEVL